MGDRGPKFDDVRESKSTADGSKKAPAKGHAAKHLAEDDDDDESSVESRTDPDESSDDDANAETGLNENQGRLLYLLSLYTHAAESESEKEKWIRKQAVMVLIYEGIVAQVFEYDYAPASELVEGRRMYFNVSQEGRSDIDFLREEELINGLKLASKEYQPTTCYQVSVKGADVARKIPKGDKEAVHELVYAKGTRELLEVEWRDNSYWMVSSSAEHESQVTQTESVSFVSSAYVPQCLRFGGRPTLSNAHRAHECSMGQSSIRDQLDEVITLNSVSIIVAEFVPFGANQIVQMNYNLGSTERVQGGFFTALVDKSAAKTGFEVDPGLTSVNILDYTLTKHINFEADIKMPAVQNITQVETFGVSMHADGTLFYGMQVEAVMDRIKDNISLDHLSRLLVEVQKDSSKIVDSVLSAYQRTLQNLIFNGDAPNRDKVNLLLANEITPHLTAEEYMDKGEYENELKQVLGDTRAAFDISEHDTLIFGANGILVAGPNGRHHEPLLCAYLQFNAMDLYVRNFFNRLFLLLDDMSTVRVLVETADTDPNAVEGIRQRLAVISRQIIQLEELLEFLAESLDQAVVPPEPPDQGGRALYERLQLVDFATELSKRVNDLKKNLKGARHELEVLREMSNIVSEGRTRRLQENLNNHTRTLCNLQEANERSSNSLALIRTVLAGSLAFDILDRLTGNWSVVESGDWLASGADSLIRNAPFVWFGVNLLLWLVVGWSLAYCMGRKELQARGMIHLRLKVMKSIHLPALRKLILSKNTAVEHRDYDAGSDVVRVNWVEGDKLLWGGAVPNISLEYDDRNKFLLSAEVDYNRNLAKKKTALNAAELKERFFTELDKAGVFVQPQVPDAAGGASAML